jgi:hypothetical protein
MTYIPPERDGEDLDRTRSLPAVSQDRTLPSAGDGELGGRAAPYQPDAPATVPFPAGDGEAGEPAGRPPRDRVVFQLVWEAVLLLLAANALFMVYQRREEILGDVPLADALDEHMSFLAPVLLIALAFGLSLRLGAVNLAVPTLAALAASAPELFIGSDPWIGLGFTAAAAALATVVFVLLVLLLRVPPWLAGMAVAAGVVAVVPLIDGEVFGYELSEAASWDPPGGAWLLGGAAVLAVIGGLIGLSPGLRDRLSAVREAVDGSGERDAATVWTFIGGVFVSSLLAACAGFLLTVFRDVEGQGEGMFAFAALPFGFFVGVELFTLIVVFLAGTSPRGRRGGVFGTVLAAVLVWTVYVLWGSFATGEEGGLQHWSGLLAFGLLVFGLAMAAVLDRLGRPKAPRPDEYLEPAQEVTPFDSQASLFDPNTESAGTPR